MRTLFPDLRQAWRSLRRRPGYLLTCAGTLALVLGANAATLAVVNATWLRPLPFTAGERVVHLFMQPPNTTDEASRNPAQQIDVVRLRERATTLRRVEGFLPGERVVRGAEGPVAVPAARVTPGLLAMLSLRTVQGRSFRSDEEAPGHDVALVTEAYWRGALGGRDVLGSALVVDGVPHTVVGVVADHALPPFLEASILTPLTLSSAPAPRSPLRSVVTLAELADGASPAQAEAEVRAVVRRYASELPATHNGWNGGVEPARQWLFGSARTPALVLFAGTALVLLIAAANIANLTIAHATARGTELALRTALGASRADLLRLQLAELSLVAAAGIVPGLIVARWAVPVLLALDPVAARTLGVVSVDARVQILTVMLGLAAALAAAVVPAWGAARRDASSTLLDGALRLTGSRAGHRARRMLVAVQVALCLALLMCSAVVIEGLRRAGRIDAGFDASQVLTAQLRLAPDAYDTPERRAGLVTRLLPRLRAMPGVVAAATTSAEFVPGNFFQTQFHVDGRLSPDGQPLTSVFTRVSPGYFETMRIAVRRGRVFTEADAGTAPAVAVISQALATQLFGDDDPLGRTLRRVTPGATSIAIVGVVDDVRDVSYTTPAQPALYLPWAQSNSNGVPVTLVLRTAGDPAAVTNGVRAAVQEIDPALPLRRVRTLDAFLADSVAPQRFRTTVLGVVAALGLVLAALGIAGVVSRAVVERRPEFAVRLALGAGGGQVVSGVLATSMADVGAGLAGGLVAGSWATSLLVRAVDGLDAAAVFPALAAVAVLAAVAAIAAVVPAAAVTRISPVEVLKAR